MTLSTDVVEYLRGERRKMTRQHLCISIVNEAAHNPAWPKATFEQWEAAVTIAIKQGALLVEGQVVWLAEKPVEKKPEQLDLF